MNKKARRSIKVKDILPNPFRNMDTYPIDRQKVKALKTSISDTDFWDNLLARPHPTKSKKVQLAFGHHRLIALKELGIKEIEFPVRNLDDATMIKVMANENMEDWKTNLGVVVETVSAAKDFLDAELSKAKSFKTLNESIKRLVDKHNFDKIKKEGVGQTTILKFLGQNWKQWTIQVALAILKDVKKGVLDLEAAQVFPNVHQASEFRKTVREIKADLKDQIHLAKNLEAKWSKSDYHKPRGISSEKKPARKRSTLPRDQAEALRALSTSLTTAQKLITRIEGKKGKRFWLETGAELKRYIIRINQTAKALTTVLNERFPSKPKKQSKKKK